MSFDIDKIKGNMHNSTATIVGQMITAGAAMLSFFFAFQAYTIINFPILLDKLHSIKYNNYSIGIFSLITICVCVILFNIWSLTVIVCLSNGFKKAINSGKSLEQTNYEAEQETNIFIFSSLDNGMKYLKGIPFIITCITMLFICFIWISFIIISIFK